MRWVFKPVDFLDFNEGRGDGAALTRCGEGEEEKATLGVQETKRRRRSGASTGGGGPLLHLEEDDAQLGWVGQVGQPSGKGSWAGVRKIKGKCDGLLESFRANWLGWLEKNRK
jgi:hypothetical protein